MRALSPSVYILSSNFPVFEVSSLTFLFNFVTCVLGVFDGQKRAPSVCSFELGVWAGAKFLGEFNARPGGTFSYQGEYIYSERMNCPMMKMNPPKIGEDKSPLSPYAPPPGRTLCYVV